MKTQTKNITLGLVISAIAALSTGTLAASQKTVLGELSEEQVVSLALQVQPGTLHHIEREIEQGKAVFEVEVTTAEGEVELILDAQSGEVLARKIDDDSSDKEDHDSDSENDDAEDSDD